MESSPIRTRVETETSLEMIAVTHTMKESGMDKGDSHGVVQNEWISVYFGGRAQW